MRHAKKQESMVHMHEKKINGIRAFSYNGWRPFNTPLSAMGRITRCKVNKDIEHLNPINEQELTHINVGHSIQ